MNYGFKCYTNDAQIIYSKYFCEMCYNNNKNYYMKYNDSNNIDSYINCYNSPEGYYLDDNDLLYKSCYESCKICNTSGNITEHYCIECKNDYIIESQISNLKNCYKYIESNTKDNIISDSFFSQLTEGEIQKDSIDEIHYLSDFKTDIFTNNFSKEEIKSESIQTITNILINEYNITDVDYILNKTLFEKNVEFVIALTNNQDNSITLKLNRCEDILKNEYNISKNDSLYLLMIIYEVTGMKIPKIEY